MFGSLKYIITIVLIIGVVLITIRHNIKYIPLQKKIKYKNNDKNFEDIYEKNFKVKKSDSNEKRKNKIVVLIKILFVFLVIFLFYFVLKINDIYDFSIFFIIIIVVSFISLTIVLKARNKIESNNFNLKKLLPFLENNSKITNVTLNSSFEEENYSYFGNIGNGGIQLRDRISYNLMDNVIYMAYIEEFEKTIDVDTLYNGHAKIYQGYCVYTEIKSKNDDYYFKLLASQFPKEKEYIKFENKNFEKRFDVYSNNINYVNKILNESLQNRLLSLFDKYGIMFEVVYKDNILCIRFYINRMFNYGDYLKEKIYKDYIRCNYINEVIELFIELFRNQI